jgi:hypothetical protein
MRLHELKAEIQAAIKCQEKTIAELSGADNPQVLRLLIGAEERKEAFEAVLRRLEGNRIAIRLFS